MKALTIIQPWAHAVIHHEKVENRTWKPPAALIGQRMAIHAGRAPLILEALNFLWDTFGIEISDTSKLPSGALIGTVRLVGVVEVRSYDRGPLITDPVMGGGIALDGRWLIEPPPGKRGYGWVFADARPAKTPIPARGAQGLWDLTTEQREALEASCPT